MSCSVVTERACIGLANQLILEFQLPIPRVQHMSEIASASFVCLFQAICGYLPNGVVEHPQTKEEEVRNVQRIIETLSHSFLHLPLTHIKGKNVIEMDVISVYNLLEIFQAYAKHASVPQQTESSSSPTTTSPTTADKNEGYSPNGSIASPVTPTWSSCMSEDRSSSSSPAYNAVTQPAVNRMSAFVGKKIQSSLHPNRGYTPMASGSHWHVRNNTQDTCADELRKKSRVKQNCKCHLSNERVGSICHVCDQEQLTCSDGPTSVSDTSGCEWRKQAFQEPTKDGWLKHHTMSPFKKMRVSPRKEEMCYKKYCPSGKKANNHVADVSLSKYSTTNAQRQAPSQQRLGNYVCQNCRTQLCKQGKENYIIHRFSEATAPTLSMQSSPGSSFLDDSSLCANCKLNLSEQGKRKYQPHHKGTPLRNLKRLDDGDRSILHHCPKTKVLPVEKTRPLTTTPKHVRKYFVDSCKNRVNFTDSLNSSEPLMFPVGNSPSNRWTSHRVKKNWSYPIESIAKIDSPVDNSNSSSSTDLHTESNLRSDERRRSASRDFTRSKIEQMPLVPSLDLDSSQETDEGPIRLRFHGSSKQVRFGDPTKHSLPQKKQNTPVYINSPDAFYRRKSQPISEESSSSKRKFQNNRILPAKRTSSSFSKTDAVSPRSESNRFKSPSVKEAHLLQRRGRSPAAKAGGHSEIRGQNIFGVSDKTFRRGATRQRAGSGPSLAWQDGVVKCAATYGFEIPYEGSSDSSAVHAKDPNIQYAQKKNQQDLLQHLQREFPYLVVPTSSIESLRNRYMQDMSRMTNFYLNGYTGKAASLEFYNLLKRQLELQNIMCKDLAAAQRKNDFQVQQYQWRKVHSMGRDQRIQSMQIKQYYEDHQLAHRSKLLHSRTKEEMLFKDLYEEGMAALHEKLRDMKKHVKEDLTQFRNEHQSKLEAIHNHYKTQLDSLAETVASQKHNLEDQEMVLKRLQREFRQKLRESLLSAQEEILRLDEEDFQFREQDKYRVKNIFRKS